MAATSSSIEWTDTTWNPVRGCARVSPGCMRCYAERLAHRFSGPGRPYEGLTVLDEKGPRWAGRAVTVESALAEPLRWRRGRRVFVNSMSDLFHDDVPTDFIARVFATMARTPQHTYQVLTKRPKRMLEVLRGLGEAFYADVQRYAGDGAAYVNAPLPNVWLGVSVEDDVRAIERVPLLLETPAAVRFLSCEPLLGELDLRAWLRISDGIHWVIVGGESGPRARACLVENVRGVVEDCSRAGVPCFVKQLGAHVVDRNDRFGVGEDEPADAREWPDNWAWDIEHDEQNRYQGADCRIRLPDSKGGDPCHWPRDLRVRQFPTTTATP